MGEVWEEARGRESRRVRREREGIGDNFMLVCTHSLTDMSVRGGEEGDTADVDSNANIAVSSDRQRCHSVQW